MLIVCPVMLRLPGPARNTVMAAMSWGCPGVRGGIVRCKFSLSWATGVPVSPNRGEIGADGCWAPVSVAC